MSRLMRALGILAVVVPLAGGAAVAQSPSFAGSWKLNLAKSQFGGMVYTIDKTPAGMIHYSGGGFRGRF